MSRKARFVVLTVFVVTVCWAPLLLQAQTKTATAVEGVKFDTAMSLTDNLKAFSGKNVYVHLKSGKTMQGYVKSVDGSLLHLEKLAGRDFYDALVRIEDISAIEAKFRDMK
jgi:hypothetical protein